MATAETAARSGFSHSAGTNAATFLYAGYNGGQGFYTLSGSGLLSGYYEYIGYNSSYSGTFSQQAGPTP